MEKPNTGFTITGPMSPKMAKIFESLLPHLPSSCDNCGHQSPDDTWRRLDGNHWACSRCGNVIKTDEPNTMKEIYTCINCGANSRLFLEHGLCSNCLDNMTDDERTALIMKLLDG